jgi:hypothetical protein
MSDFNLGDKWQDLEVTTWPWEESIENPIQTDGYAGSVLPLGLFKNPIYLHMHVDQYLFKLLQIIMRLVCAEMHGRMDR